MVDKILFKLKNKEQNAIGEFDVAEIYINDKELSEIVYDIEKASTKCPEKYLHLLPIELYHSLHDALDPVSDSFGDGIDVLCCQCGVSGCNSPMVFIEQDDQYVYWTKIVHNQTERNYNLSYKFDRNIYLQELEKLKLML